ncbi:MAG: hypothetical protein ABIG44_09330 [Planctomycetota bacterium]
MPSPLTRIPGARRGRVLSAVGAALVACAGLMTMIVTGCHDARQSSSRRELTGVYPPTPQIPRVIALGNLRGSPSPSQTEIELARFLFGAEPPPPLAIANPAGLVASAECVLVCDAALDTVFRWDPASGRLTEACKHLSFEHPFAIDIAPEGVRLVCDRRGVLRCDEHGNVQCSYRPDLGDFKPTGVLAVGDEVWISNDALHRIEVFDTASGQHLRSIGSHGHEPGQFCLPRGLARTPDGNVCVVDMLDNRVQVFDPAGNWLRNIGQSGDCDGSFGRPKDVAVGPDGTVFVSDAFSQRVHAFDADGQTLLAFGEPGSGVGELTLPNGVAIITITPRTDRELPPNVSADYYVLVAEQLNRPGVRVYAWLGADEVQQTPPTRPAGATDWKPVFPESVALNPHWHAERCTACHQQDGEQLLPIGPETIDDLCVSCHDGRQAPADPHPIGRPARTELITTPAEWPTVNGEIGCLTCHDIKEHCQRGARRPVVNRVLLRGYDPQRPLAYCSTCHRVEVSGRFSPHRQRDATGQVRDDACFFCHAQRPEVPADGRRRFDPKLRVDSSELCLNCHSKHWDLSPLGHVDRPVTPRIRQWMLMRELSIENGTDLRHLARLAAESERDPARLPLGEDKVTCYTCHNPHYAGLFPENSELGTLAGNPQDRASALRADWIDLCSECHSR